MLARLIVTLLPQHARVRLRRSPRVRGMIRRMWGGVRSLPFLDSPYRLYYDGYRNIGYEGHGLANLEREERAAVRRLLVRRARAAIWDVGANIGFWSLFLTTAAPAGTEIRCFEPDADNLEILQLNRDRNQLRWVIRPVGLSDHAGSATFYRDSVTGATGSLEEGHDFVGKHYGAGRTAATIVLTTLDSELASGAAPPGFIKIDVEGHELAVLRGGRRLLQECRPILIFEATREREAVAQLLEELDYRLFNPQGRPQEKVGFNTLAVPAEAADAVW